MGPANSAELGGGPGGTGARPAGTREGRARNPGVRPGGGAGGGGGPNMADPRPSGRPIGGTGGPGAEAVAPAANEGEAGPLPGPIPGGPRGGDPMAPRGADYLSGGARPTCGQWRRVRPGSARQPEAVRGRPRAPTPRGGGLRAPRFPGGAPALQRPGNLLGMQATSGAPAQAHGIETPAVCANQPWVVRRGAPSESRWSRGQWERVAGDLRDGSREPSQRRGDGPAQLVPSPQLLSSPCGIRDPVVRKSCLH